MGTWYLYESDGTTQITSTTAENLVYTFPQNPGSSDITYKVKYVDNSRCIGELGIKQDGCAGCDCDALAIPESTIQIGSAATKQNIGTIRGNCADLFSAREDIPWFDVYVEGTNVVLSAQTNTTEPNGRQGGIQLYIGDSPCVNPLMVKQSGGKALFNIYIYGVIDTDNTKYTINIGSDRDDSGLPSAREYPLTISDKSASYHYTNCSRENVSPTTPLPVSYNICRGSSGDILGQPVLDTISCRVAIAGADRRLVVRSTKEKDEFEWTIQDITYHVQLTMSKPSNT